MVWALAALGGGELLVWAAFAAGTVTGATASCCHGLMALAAAMALLRRGGPPAPGRPRGVASRRPPPRDRRRPYWSLRTRRPRRRAPPAPRHAGVGSALAPPRLPPPAPPSGRGPGPPTP